MSPVQSCCILGYVRSILKVKAIVKLYTSTCCPGSQSERADIRYEVLYNGDEYNVILSTYVHLTIGPLPHSCPAFFASYSVCIGQTEDRRFLRKLSLQCLVLDEGHMLKNMATQRYNHLMKIKVSQVSVRVSQYRV